MQLPPELMMRAYRAADGRMAWHAEDVPAVLRAALGQGVEPTVVEAWMVFEDGGFAGTHCTAIYIDADRSTIHRLPLDAEQEPWDAARRYVDDCPAARQVHPEYAGTIRFHIGFRDDDPPPAEVPPRD